MALFNRARPIGEVIADERTPPKIRGLLSEIPAIKSFGEQKGLKQTKNYVEFVQLDRPVAVWVVSACAPLEFKSKQWRFPLVGSFPFLGWFDLDDARGFAKELRREGYDVDVRGAGAYSTLGWFRDAVLSSMIHDGDEALGELVNVVLHESVHSTFYLSGQSYFNESIASFVADGLTQEYLASTRGAKSPEERAYNEGRSDYAERELKLHGAYEALSSLYASSRSDDEKRTEKQKLLAGLKAELKYKREITNATLIQFKTYNVGQAEFEALFRACNSSWERFWAAIRTLKPEAFSKEHQEDLAPAVMPLVSSGCPG